MILFALATFLRNGRRASHPQSLLEDRGDPTVGLTLTQEREVCSGQILTIERRPVGPVPIYPMLAAPSGIADIATGRA